MKKPIETPRNPMAAAPVNPPLVQPTDSALTGRVRQAIDGDGRLAGQNVTVAVRQGCVMLTGAVSKEFLRLLADARAGGVPGVLVVMNQLGVLQEGPMRQGPV
ncbi:BON domain-containing protein [Frigidibacter sp. SD6-1]|uniref:BON domain-containing protein n=1 Tax=Frigidibacter sp. SD6-1 TaxID=3032581 RepID=UPI0024E01649|nr:BON domain-containing protein [Frigidibacter sp. SD6-1]